MSSETGKASKGLRHFSMKVCKKVEEKGQTTYNEVADELVREFMSVAEQEASAPVSAVIVGGADSASVQPAQQPQPGAKPPKKTGQYDEKNIRRRVYDALNVLMAMDIISKEKKEIRWKGLPSNAQRDLEVMERERAKVLEEVEEKKRMLKDLIVQSVCFRNLKGEAEREGEQGNDAGQEQQQQQQGEGGDGKIPLPFIVVNTSQSTVINCEMGSDRTDVFFNFSKPFEINDDFEILKRLGMGKAGEEGVKECVGEEVFEYAKRNGLLEGIVNN